MVENRLGEYGEQVSLFLEPFSCLYLKLSSVVRFLVWMLEIIYLEGWPACAVPFESTRFFVRRVVALGEVTGNDKADGDVLESLLEQLPETAVVEQVLADGAYDKRKCYDALRRRKVQCVAIPPQHNARIWQHGNTKAERFARDENLRQIRRVGRKQWKVEAHYHRRSLSETGMFRLKTIVGDRVSARTDACQRTQLLLRCYALNKMTTLGMPKSYASVA